MQGMISEAEKQAVRPIIQSLRIIVVALVMGVATFAGVTIIMRGERAFLMSASLTGFPILAMLATVLGVAMSLVLYSVLTRRTPQTAENREVSDAGREALAAGEARKLMTATIVACALLEAPAFFNLIVVYLGTGGLLHLILAGGLAAMMLARFPFNEGAFFERVERQLAWPTKFDG